MVGQSAPPAPPLATPLPLRKLFYILICFPSQDEYDEAFRKEVYGAPEVKLKDLQKSKVAGSPVRIRYSTKDSFKSMAKALGIMNDFKVSRNQGDSID